jgi:predicted ArsR family transcriptional regulator
VEVTVAVETFGKAEQSPETSLRHDGSTRQAVLKLLKTRGSATASELAGQLGLTDMAVRRHLAALEQDGYITPVTVRQPMGRPAFVYQLTEEAEHFFPKNYHLLMLDLLEELELGQSGSDAVGELFEARRRKLLGRYASRMQGKKLRDRVAELADIQNAGGYMVEVEDSRDDSEFVLHEYNCPIAQVAGRYQQACQCELTLFRELLGTSVERTECLAKGGGKCTYRIGSAGSTLEQS